MENRHITYIDIEIDKLTNSIENVISGDVFDTELIQLTTKENKQIKQAEWLFEWNKQLKLTDREVYKLVIKNNNSILQGLISLSDRGDHVFMHLI